MDLMRWDPFHELEEMRHRLNRALSARRSGGPAGNAPAATPREEMMAFADWVPAVDVKETPEEYLIKAEIPEVNKEDVKVAIKDGVLTIAGERKIEKEEKGKKFHRIERAYGSFMRNFTVPEGVDEAKLAATYKDGVLEVHLPKSPHAKPRAIEVKVT